MHRSWGRGQFCCNLQSGVLSFCSRLVVGSVLRSPDQAPRHTAFSPPPPPSHPPLTTTRGGTPYSARLPPSLGRPPAGALHRCIGFVAAVGPLLLLLPETTAGDGGGVWHSTALGSQSRHSALHLDAAITTSITGRGGSHWAPCRCWRRQGCRRPRSSGPAASQRQVSVSQFTRIGKLGGSRCGCIASHRRRS